MLLSLLLVLNGDLELVVLLNLLRISHPVIPVELSTFDSDFSLGYFHLGLEVFGAVSKADAQVGPVGDLLKSGRRTFPRRVAELRDIRRLQVLDVLGEFIGRLVVLLGSKVFLGVGNHLRGPVVLKISLLQFPLPRKENIMRRTSFGHSNLFGSLWSDFHQLGLTADMALVESDAEIVLDDLKLVGRYVSVA